jgi:site-specific recombinase XerC
MNVARSLTPRLRGATYETLIGLLSVTGARVGELIGLDRDDVDLDEGALVIRYTKSNKSREVPLQPTAVEALRSYVTVRDELCPRPRTSSFFVPTIAKRLAYVTVQHTFGENTRAAGLRSRSGRCRPRLHDTRHSFACASPARLVSEGLRCGRAPPAALHVPGPHQSGAHLLVSLGDPRVALPGSPTPRARSEEPAMTALAPTLEAWFTGRLVGQRHASPNTIAAYRDAWRLLLTFVQSEAGKDPSQLDIADLDAECIRGFLAKWGERKEEVLRIIEGLH